jgi:hypothetical protein
MKSARDRWFEMLAAERDRRHYAELLVDGIDPRAALLETLAGMHERLVANPNFMVDQEELSRSVDLWFKKRFPKAR